MAIFSKFFGDLMSHIIRECADEETKYFLNVKPFVDKSEWKHRYIDNRATSR